MTRLPKIARSRSGFTILEFLVAAIVVVTLATSSVATISKIQRWAKTTQARAEMTQLSIAMEMVKSDTGSYTLNIKNLGSQTAPLGITRGWDGPYLKGTYYLDPWNNPYELALPKKNGVEQSFIKKYLLPGGSDTFTITAGQSSMRLDSENGGNITSAAVTLNGILVATVSSTDLPKLVSPVMLNANNTLSVVIAGDPTAVLQVFIPGVVSAKEPYLITSLSADETEGGTGLDADIVWHSSYPGFEN